MQRETGASRTRRRGQLKVESAFGKPERRPHLAAALVHFGSPAPADSNFPLRSAFQFHRRLLFLLILTVCGRLLAADPRPDLSKVEVAPTRTSIYIGLVSLTTPDFVRQGDRFESTYTAKVFPYFFANENGQLGIDFNAEQLARLNRGETVEFTGSATNHEGQTRRLEGKATPADALQGKLKVRVQVSPKIELIFNTTYRFKARTDEA